MPPSDPDPSPLAGHSRLNNFEVLVPHAEPREERLPL